MKWLLAAAVRHPRTLLAVVAATTVGAVWLAPAIELRLDGRSLVPERHPALVANDRAAARWQLGDVVIVAVHRPDGILAPAGLQHVTDVGRGLAACPAIRPGSVASIATMPRLSIAAGRLDLRPLAATSGIDPEIAAILRTEITERGLADGVLVSADERTAAIYATAEPGADLHAVHDCVAAVAARARTAGVDVVYSGTALAQAILGDAAVRDLTRLIPLVLVILGAVLFAAFKHPLPALVALAEVGISLIWTVGLMGALGERVFITTLSLPVVLLVIGVSDDVYALSAYAARRRREPGRDVSAVVQEVFAAEARPTLLTAATTMVALLSLLLTGVEPQRIFGTYGAVAIGVSTVFTFSLLPAVLVLANPAVHRWREPGRLLRADTVRRLFDSLERVGWRRIVAASAAVAVAAAAVAAGVRIDDNWVRNLPSASDVAAGDRIINLRLAGTNTLDLMIDTGIPDGLVDPRRLAAIGAFETKLARHPDVGAVAGVFDDVSRAVAGLEARDVPSLRRELTTTRRLTGPEIEHALVLLESLRDSPVPRRFDDERRRARVTLFVRGGSYAVITRVLAAVDGAGREAGDAVAGVTPFGDGWVGHQSIGLIVAGQMRGLLTSLGANVLLLGVLLGSLAGAAVAVAPVAFVIVIVLAILSASATALGTATSMFTAVAVGVGADYAIHYVAVCRERRRRGDSPREAVRHAATTTASAILTSAVALALGFLTLRFSSVAPNRDLGLLVSLSVLGCALAALVLVPALLLAFERRAAATPRARRSAPPADYRIAFSNANASAAGQPAAAPCSSARARTAASLRGNG